MSDDEKAYYKEKAKSDNVRIPKPRFNSYKSQDASVSTYEQKAMEKKKQTEYMRLRIGNMIQQIPLMTGMKTT